ncbi:BTB/POZ domain-containing protein 6-like [Haliotis asinina]|uniref:BTB/POZ domain-containing protein 6-like n=1 Tax=Haliotis asinina TaxID=109174 RepID=UPI0035325153
MATSVLQPAEFVDNWQAGKTLAECNLRMFDAEDSCDVTFRVGSSGDEIKAHSYVLISRSCVFHAMFTGSLTEKNSVSVPEIAPKHFRQFLLYLYTDDTDIDAQNVTALLYASRKYAITALGAKCRKFLKINLSVDNACVILEAAYRFDENLLYKKVMTLVNNNGEKSLQSSGFMALSQELVDKIVESDDLAAREHVIFTAVNNWAEAQCKRQGREVTPENKKSILGETLMKVRFPLLKPTFLGGEVKASGLLSDSERLKIFDYRDNPGNEIHPFNAKQRPAYNKLPFHDVCRFQPQPMFNGCTSGRHSISFSTSTDVMLIGYELYGSPIFADIYSVTSYLGDEDAVLNCIHDAKDYEDLHDTFDVLWEKPVAIRAGQWYTLEVDMCGYHTWCGTGGRKHVVCDKGSVIFHFRNSDLSKNGTTVFEGQIPSLFYRLG